jgi:hypothetical protein
MNVTTLRNLIIGRLAQMPGAKSPAYWQGVVGDIRVGPSRNWSISLHGTLEERLAMADAAWEIQREWPFAEH